MTLLAEKRKVGSSTLPLTTIASPAGSLHYLRLACSRDVLSLFWQECRGLQQSVVVSVGISWGGLERGLVGFLRGAPEAVGGSCSCLSQDFGHRLPVRVRGPARVAGNGPAGSDWLAITG